MKNWIIFVLIYFFSLLQVTLLNNFKFFGIKPDLLLAGVVILSVFLEWRWVLFYSLFAGMLKDVFCFEPAGINTILFPALAYLVHKLSRKISLEDRYALMVVVFISVFLHNSIVWIICGFSAKVIPLGIFIRGMFIGCLYSAIISPFILKILYFLRYRGYIKI